MAAQDPSVYVVPSADVVGNAFARQYYTILQQSPGLVHRFYQDISKLGRNSDNGVMASTTTMDAINAKIQSYGCLKADIKYVDAQDSYNGGVIVLVTGSMVKDDDSRRDFTQTFFLAPQDKGYYVLNDIFRYVDEDAQDSEKQNGGVVSATASQEETPPVQENHIEENHVQENQVQENQVQENHVEENHITEEANGEVYNPHENGEVPVEEEEVVQEEEPVAEVVDEAPNNSEIVVESNAKVVDDAPTDSQTPKKSYASIVMKDTPVAASSPNVLKPMPKVQEQQILATPSPVPMAPPSSADMIDDNSSHEPEGDCHSIYLKNLPHNVSYSSIEEALKRFGTVKSGGIQIRFSKGFVFGFAEFEETGAAQSAIEASPITIAGRDVVVEEKRSTNRGTGRRFVLGRGGGGGFRGEGGRGRGSYGGGRGYGRVENRNDYGNRDDNRNDFGNRGGGRGHHKHRNEGFQRSDQTGIGVGRANRGGGSGIGSMTRTHRVPAHA